MINILIFDFKTNGIYTLYPNDIMNPWRPFLLFAKSDNNWEPIRNQEKNHFSYNDTVIKKILTGNQNIEIKYYDGSIIKKDFVLVDNINEIMDEEFKSSNKENILSDDSDNSSINDAFISNNEQEIKPTKNKLTKMTKDELMKYMKSLNIKFNTKSTKKDLIELVDTQ
jgi:hypothetical protein